MCRPLCGHHPGGVKKKIFIWSGGTSFYKERVVETCDGRHHPMVVVEDDVLAEPWVGEQVGCLGSKLKSNRKSSRDICDGGWDILWGVIERFWVELREKAWDRRQLEGRPFELGKENWSKRGINTQKDRLDRRKYRYCFYKLQFYFFSCPCHFIVFFLISRDSILMSKCVYWGLLFVFMEFELTRTHLMLNFQPILWPLFWDFTWDIWLSRIDFFLKLI